MDSMEEIDTNDSIDSLEGFDTDESDNVSIPEVPEVEQGKFIISVRTTSEQIEVVKQLFVHNEWGFDEISGTSNETQQDE